MKQLPVTKEKRLSLKKDAYLSQRQTILMRPEVSQKVNTLDLKIAHASVELPVRKYEDSKLVEKTSILVKFLCKDFGVVSSGQDMQYAAARFLSTIKNYYDDLSIKEIKMAFELASVGELDEWLPKDKNGNPDAKAYNSFNVDFYTKILKAYRAKRSKVWHGIKKALPSPDLEISQEQRLENRKAFINDIYKSFDEYKNKQIKPNFVLSIFIEELVSQGLIKELKKPLKSTLDKVYRNMLLKTKGKERKSLIDKYHSSKYDGVLLTEAQAMQNNIDIKMCFDDIIENKKDIRDLLTY